MKLKSVSQKNLVDYKCIRYLRNKRYPKKFRKENMAIPCPVPTELQGLYQCEEMLIARVFQMMQVYMKPQYRTITCKRHIVTLTHNVQKIADILPNLVSELPIVVFQTRDRDNKNFNFKVRCNFVLKAFCLLQKHNVLYKNVVINTKRVNQLPEDDYLDVCSISVKGRKNSSDAYDCGAVEGKEKASFIESSSFLPKHTNVPPKELDR